MNSDWFGHSGELGDIIYSLPTIRAKCGGTLILYHKPGLTARGIDKAKTMSLRPLLEIQPYIKGVLYVERDDLRTPYNQDHKLNQFRKMKAPYRNLADMHLYTHELSSENRENAWLTVDRIVSDYPVIIHRSPRYHNSKFPWKRVFETYKRCAVIVGTREEWRDLTNRYGVLPYLETTNLLELARVIAGCKVFIGNQSCPEAICEGLKMNKILEVSTENPNSCIFKRLGAVYVDNEWHIELPVL